MYPLYILLEPGGTNIFQLCNTVRHTALNYKHCVVLYCIVLCTAEWDGAISGVWQGRRRVIDPVIRSYS